MPAGNLLDLAPHVLMLPDIACAQTTGDSLADSLADFPGPVAGSTAATVQITH
jgi:hypothetical protein